MTTYAAGPAPDNPAPDNPAPDNLASFAAAAAARLESATPHEIVAWAHATYGDRVVVTSSMGDALLTHLCSEVVPGIEVLFLDTGYHFAETLGTRDAVADTCGAKVRTILPLLSVAEQDAQYGERLYARDPDACCQLRKVEPLNRELRDYDAWISGLRRDETRERSDIPVVALDTQRAMIKINPLASWTQQQADEYMRRNNVLVNPLVSEGYPSIGCAPCTRKVTAGADPRSGRWAGFTKSECGLHG